MARVTLELPSLLRDVLHHGSIPIEADTLEEALDEAYRRVPTLRVHVCDESGKLRPHVLCFLNDLNTRWLEGPAPPLKDGDSITILQAVSGG